MLGTSLIAAHMLIFWYSQDANVTPPVCLAAYSASGIAGSKPLETGFESWKLAKGIYLIPLLFVYTPILFEGSLWEVIETSIAALTGLFCIAVFFEGIHIKTLNWLYRIFYLATGVLLLWPNLFLHMAGVGSLLLMIVLQKFANSKLPSGKLEQNPSSG